VAETPGMPPQSIENLRTLVKNSERRFFCVSSAKKNGSILVTLVTCEPHTVI
jgi:hypothetical protein